MSLLTDAYVPCVIMDKTTQKDSYGGVITVWIEGAEIQAAITPNGSVEQLIAQQRDYKGSYTIVTPRSVVLWPDDKIKRLEDGRVFRVTEDGTDRKTPESAALDARAVKAEDYKL